MIRCLVISAVNLFEGGPLTVLRDCLAGARMALGSEWKIVAIIHDRRLIDQRGVELLEFPQARSSWLSRAWYEYHHFRKLSAGLRSDLWLSLNDMTPIVGARRRAIYCHTPLPFYPMKLRTALTDPVSWRYAAIHRLLYRFNIRSNSYVVVQQAWMRRILERRYGLDNVVVAHPRVACAAVAAEGQGARRRKVFLYPSFPRNFKNFEAVCEAAAILVKEGISDFEVRLTISGAENAYASGLLRRYDSCPAIRFIGRQDRGEMEREYRNCDVVVFPSRMETWGLPISEAKTYGKRLMVADLEYGHETVGNCDAAAFFDPDDPEKLADMMLAEIAGRSVLGPVQRPEPAPPFVRTWEELILFLTHGL